MPDETSPRDEAIVFTAGADAVDENTIQRLRDEFGLELQVRSSSSAIQGALRGLGDIAVVFFDKTYPGYDKVFDKTSPGAEVMDVINPVDLASRLSDIERRLGPNRPQ